MLSYDKSATIEEYKKIPSGSSDKEELIEYKRFSNLKSTIYPNEIMNLFEKLGIDKNKEDDCWFLGEEPNGKYSYSILFYFIGKVIEGEQAVVSRKFISDGKELEIYNHHLFSFSEDFKIGFTNSTKVENERLIECVDINIEILVEM